MGSIKNKIRKSNMPPPDLKTEDGLLVRDLIETFKAGHPKPESTSDFIRGFIAVLTMFDVKRRPLPYDPIQRERRDNEH